MQWPLGQRDQIWQLEQRMILESMPEQEIAAIIVSGKLPVRIGQDQHIAVSSSGARSRHSSSSGNDTA